MTKEKIIIDIDENGEIVAEAFEYTGEACLIDIDRLMKGLANSTGVVKKPEFYENKQTTNQKQKVGNK